jgi:hypothetical protein
MIILKQRPWDDDMSFLCRSLSLSPSLTRRHRYVLHAIAGLEWGFGLEGSVMSSLSHPSPTATPPAGRMYEMFVIKPTSTMME